MVQSLYDLNCWWDIKNTHTNETKKPHRSKGGGSGAEPEHPKTFTDRARLVWK